LFSLFFWLFNDYSPGHVSEDVSGSPARVEASANSQDYSDEYLGVEF
jgi:hypothetical protein